MSIHRFQSTWRSLTFNPHYDNSGITDNPANVNTGLLQSAGGLVLDAVNHNRVSVQDFRELRQFLEGGEPNEAFEGVRSIELQGRIIGISTADLEDKAWLLNEQFSVAACRHAAESSSIAVEFPLLLPFTFRRARVAGVQQLMWAARPGPARPVWIGRRNEGFVRPFSAQLIAFDPFAYDAAQVTTAFTVFAGQIINSPGNVYSKPIIEFVFSGAGATNLTLTNTTISKGIILNASTAAAGEVWRLNTRTSTLTRVSDGSNRYSQRTAGWMSELLLIPGNNNFAASNTAGLTRVDIKHRGAYA